MSRIEGDEEMAQSGFALVQLSSDLADGSAGAMDGTNGGGAVKIVKVDPVGLELRDRESLGHGVMSTFLMVHQRNTTPL